MSEETPPGWPPPTAPPQWQPPQWQPPYGYPQYGGYGYPQPRNTNGFCIAALVCSLVGVFVWVIGPVLGIVFGAIGLRQTTRRGESGRGLAIAGLVVGGVMLLLNIVLLVSVFATSSGPTISNGPSV